MNKPIEAESEVFDRARSLVETVETILPNADPEELKRTCEAAVTVAVNERLFRKKTAC